MPPETAPPRTGELKRFLLFLASLWGVLGGISVFFPLSNRLIEGGVPVAKWEEGGGFAFLSPALVTTVSTLVSIFIVLWTYGEREGFHKNLRHTRRRARVCFIFGMVALVAYAVAYNLLQHDFHYTVLGWTSDDSRRLLFDLILVALYSAFFGLLTRAFLLLAAVEYFRKETAKGGATSAKG